MTEEATKKFGIGSHEARLAWEVVEDVENKGGAIHLNTFAPKSTEGKVRALEQNMAKLEELSNAAKSVNIQIQSEVLKLQSIKLGGGVKKAATAVTSPAYKSAKAEAEAASAKYGKESR